MSEVNHIPIQLRFREPLITARGRIESRRGFLLGTEYEGLRYVSEICLLPEFGTEYFEHAERVLHVETRMMPSAPATLFGLDCMRISSEKEWSKSVTVPIAYLLPGGNPEAMPVIALQAYKQGYREFKLKIGIRSVAEEVKLVRALCDAIPAKFRLDLNMAWTLETLDEFLSQIDCLRIEWIEDPSAESPDAWDSLQSKYTVEFACDEALRANDLMKRSDWKGFRVLVVKPPRVGPIADVIRLCERAQNHGKKVVFSSLMESSIGMTYVAHLAAKYGSEGVSHGLGTLWMMKDDTISPTLSFAGGVLTAPPIGSLGTMLLPKYAEKLWPT